LDKNASKYAVEKRVVKVHEKADKLAQKVIEFVQLWTYNIVRRYEKSGLCYSPQVERTPR
jgi:hypothetical protein